jgi:hypothetical protein
MRANLLPQAGTEWRLFGLRVARDEVRALGITLAVVAALMLPSWATLAVLTARSAAEADAVAANLRADAIERVRAYDLAQRVARLKAIAHEATLLQSSGLRRAMRIATLGNALPDDAWYERLAQDAEGWHITGRSLRLDDVAAALDRMRAPGTRTILDDIENRDSYVEFHATIGPEKPTHTPRDGPQTP